MPKLSLPFVLVLSISVQSISVQSEGGVTVNELPFSSIRPITIRSPAARPDGLPTEAEVLEPELVADECQVG